METKRLIIVIETKGLIIAMITKGIIIVIRGLMPMDEERVKFHTHVNPPKPILVKKLILNLVLRGLSLGNNPSNDSAKNLKRQRTIY